MFWFGELLENKKHVIVECLIVQEERKLPLPQKVDAIRLLSD